MKRGKLSRTIAITGTLSLVLLSCAGCSTARKILAADTSKDAARPIADPFGDYQASEAPANPADSMIFRAKQGNGAVEVELPRAQQGVTDFVLPMPNSEKASRGLASVPAADSGDSNLYEDSQDINQATAGVDNSYLKDSPTPADREITRHFSDVPLKEQEKRDNIEQGLGLVTAPDPTPERQQSYLAHMDHIKQLYRVGRFEAALIEVEAMIRDYPMDPKLHEMRGTLLAHLGQNDLALKSWNQALRLDPSNESLRRFVEHRNRQPASEAGTP